MFFIKPFKMIYNYRKILWSTSWSDIKTKYAGSVLGIFWLILYPLLLLGIYSFVYIFIFSARMGEMTRLQYVFLIFSGLIPFLGFTEALALSIPSVSSNAALIKNTMYPIDILPVKAVIVSECTQAVGLTILLCALLVNGQITPYTLLVIPIWLFQILLSIGLGWILAAINVFMRDLQNIITLLTIFLMMISPIAYTVDMIPANLRPFMSLNIMYYMITSYQDALVVGCMPRNYVLPIFAAISLLVFCIGYYFFDKMKYVFSDNV